MILPAKRYSVRLCATFVRTASVPGRYGDGYGGLGLSLVVTPRKSGYLSKDLGAGRLPQRHEIQPRPRILARGHPRHGPPTARSPRRAPSPRAATPGGDAAGEHAPRQRAVPFRRCGPFIVHHRARRRGQRRTESSALPAALRASPVSASPRTGIRTAMRTGWALCADVKLFQRAVRSHWGIENKLHWRVGRDIPRRRKPDSSRQWSSQYRGDPPCGDEPAQAREDEDQLQKEANPGGSERCLPR